MTTRYHCSVLTIAATANPRQPAEVRELPPAADPYVAALLHRLRTARLRRPHGRIHNEATPPFTPYIDFDPGPRWPHNWDDE